ncbi:unnamed protein product [Phaedon cochleariae]|uniref:CCHC-type domain-containing protein n=1 Tax=Phaedon cochleariae TaxID=80249 RepID=A0A9N9SC05_PHACE|nr:unnamed protein product [Phaedon cochleariae]
MSGNPPPGGGGPSESANLITSVSSNNNIGIYDLTHDEEFNHNEDQAANGNMKSAGKGKEGPSIPNRNGNRSTQMEVDDRTNKNLTPRFFNLDKVDQYDKGNIYIYIEKNNEENIGKLHPMSVGHILHKKLNVKDIIQISKAGNNRVKVQLKSITEANNLMNNKLLEKENLKAFIPNHLLVRKGLIFGMDTVFDEKYIMDNITSDANILEVSRMKRRVMVDGQSTLVPRQIVILTFEGTILPKAISINSVYFEIEPYVSRVVQCFKCLRYGHVSKQCRSKNTLCQNCAQQKEENHNCDQDKAHCLYCETNDHNTLSNKCPHLEKQKSIKKYMAQTNSTFTDAKRVIENSYANITTSNRFDLLSNFNFNFPSLPSTSNHPNNNNVTPKPIGPMPFPTQTLSQPTKKRKVHMTSPQPPTVPPMFPFQFGPSQPVPHNKTVPSLSQEEVVSNVMDLILNILSGIHNLEDIKNLNDSAIKNEIIKVLDKAHIFEVNSLPK